MSPLEDRGSAAKQAGAVPHRASSPATPASKSPSRADGGASPAATAASAGRAPSSVTPGFAVKPGSSTSAPPSTSPASPQPAAVQVELSTGVALAQTLPSGTGMLFSVDYTFLRGQPDPSTQYSLVITPGTGSSFTFGVSLQSRGTLQVVKERTRPEVGPFTAHLEAAPRAGPRQPISARIPLKQP